MSNQVDRFFAAVSVLAGHGHIKQRLMKAYEDNLEAIDEDELPVAIKQAFADLRRDMHRVTPANGEGTICASVRKMSVGEASECAVSVVALFQEVSRLSDGKQRAQALDSEERKTVPPFLVKSS